MKKFDFRLEKIRNYRETLKQQSEKEFAEKSQEFVRAEKLYESLLDERQRQKIPYDKILTAAELLLLSDYEGFIQELLRKQTEAMQGAETAMESAREELIEKSREEKALSLLKDKQAEIHREEFHREHKKEVSEIALRGHRRRDTQKEDK